MKEKTGAPLMLAGFGEIPYIEHGMFNPPANTRASKSGWSGTGPGRAEDQGGPRRFPSRPRVRWRELFDGDVVKVGPLSVTTYLTPGHGLSSTTFAYTVRDGGRDYKVVEFYYREYPEDLSQNAFITEATVRHTFETLRKLYPVDIYLETSVSNWSGILSQPSGTVTGTHGGGESQPETVSESGSFQ